jgi:D-arabinitol dehydrogenase (NADP+)
MADDDQPNFDILDIGIASPYGWDIVVEATGTPTVLESSIQYVPKGGKLVIYVVYDEKVNVAWSRFLIWKNEITILTSFCSRGHIPHVMEYVNTGKLKLGGIVNRTHKIEEWAECLEAVRKQKVVKAAIVFD